MNWLGLEGHGSNKVITSTNRLISQTNRFDTLHHQLQLLLLLCLLWPVDVAKLPHALMMINLLAYW